MNQAEEILEDLGLEAERIESIKALIAATDPEKRPESLGGRILQGADTACMTGENFFEKQQKMMEEFKDEGLFKGSLKGFYRQFVPHVEGEFHTEAAEMLYGEKRRENLERLKQKL